MKVLISPGYGAGWSTWNQKEMAIDPVLIEAFEKGIEKDEMYDLCIKQGYAPLYMKGFWQLKVVEVPAGELFQIREYDGAERIEFFDESDWLRAE